MQSFDRDKLISAIYTAANSPEYFDEMLESFHDLMFGGRPEELDFNLVFGVEISDILKGDGRQVVDPDLLLHLQRAHEIQLRIGRPKKEKNKILMLLDAAPNPAYIIDLSGTVIAQNKHSRNLALSRKLKIADFVESPEIVAEIRRFISSGGKQNILVVPGYINVQRNSNTCVLVRKIERQLDDGLEEPFLANGEYYFCTIVDLGFDQSRTELFRKTYGLTTAEVDIAVLLASGMQIQEVAAERGASIATIRTQIKTIKTKTNSRDIPALVRLVCGFSAGILISSQLEAPAPVIASPTGPLKVLRDITLRDGRRLSFMEQGHPDGEPVLIVHNMPYGVDIPEGALAAAHDMRMRLISPFRPGFGYSDPVKNAHGDALLDTVAYDLRELLGSLGVSKADILGHAVGTNYVVRFAKLFPDRVANLFGVARAPIWREEWLSQIPKRQRFVIRIARYLPQMLPVIGTATTMYIDSGYGEKLVNTLCSDSPADMAALKNQEVMDLMVKGCKDGLRQGADAFCRDCVLPSMDMTVEARSLEKRFHLLHGAGDRIIDVSHTRAYVDAVPGTTLEIVEGAGNLMFYSHWEPILAAIKNKQK